MKPADAQDLLLVDPIPRALIERAQFSLVHLTAYAVHWLTVWEIPTIYENVTVLSARLFPADFSLPGFPQFPDSIRTTRSLMQMRPKYRGFATSDPRKGVFLTEKGREAANRVVDAFLGGWEITGTYRQTSGLPFSVSAGPNLRTKSLLGSLAGPVANAVAGATNPAASAAVASRPKRCRRWIIASPPVPRPGPAHVSAGGIESHYLR